MDYNVDTFKKYRNRWLGDIPDTNKLMNTNQQLVPKKMLQRYERKTNGKPACEVAMSPYEDVNL